MSPGHRHVRVLYAAQTSVAPPTFVLFTNVATKLHFSYERFLQNRLRDKYGFVGTPHHDRGSQAIARSVERPNSADGCVIYSTGSSDRIDIDGVCQT